MSTLHINQIKNKITALFEEHLDLTDLKLSDQEREHKIATRCLAAYAIYSTVECSAKEAAQAVVDSGDDNGIDAIFYSPMNKIMILVQAKLSKTGSGEPEAADIAKFTNGARDLFALEFDRFNDRVKTRSAIIMSALNEYDTKYYMIVIDTFTSLNLSPHAMRHVDDLLTEMNNTGDDTSEQLVKFSRINQAKVYSTLAMSAGNSPIDIEVGLSQWGQMSDPYKAVYGIGSGSEISSWWETYNNRLFEKNIRQVLGVTEVNEEIERTLKETQNLFWYYNNGITITCDKIEKTAVGGGARDIGTFKLTNAAIVNGAQTVSSLGKYALSQNPKLSLDDVKVSVRVIQLSDAPEVFGKDVTRTNNRQNRIENRDFVSQDPEQNRIKMELAIDGIDYNVMRSENYTSGEKAFDLIEATAALACASGNIRLAVQAKGGIGRFWDNLDKGIYKEIFNPSISGHYVYNCVKLIRAIEDVLKKETLSLPKRSGRPYGLLVHGNRLIEMLTISKLGIGASLNGMSYIPDEVEIERVTKAVIALITTNVDNDYAGSFLATLFKNLSKCSAIANRVRATTI